MKVNSLYILFIFVFYQSQFATAQMKIDKKLIERFKQLELKKKLNNKPNPPKPKPDPRPKPNPYTRPQPPKPSPVIPPKPVVDTSNGTCSEIDLTSRMGPVNLQPAGDCFAQAATDLINFRGKEQLSSAYLGNKARLAREIAKRGSKSLTFGYTGGQPIDVLAISNEKACPEGIITDSESLFGATNKGILRNSINDFEKYFVQIHKGKITGYETTNQEELVRVYNESKQAPVSYNCFKNNISLMFPMIRDFREVAKIITETDNISLAYSKIADLNCQKYLVHVEPPVKPVSYYYDGLELYNQVPLSTQFSKPIKTTDSKQQFMINKINERLNLKQPLVISYLTGNSLGIKGNSMHTAHASVVVGRKWNKETKQCMYEIRNSWGTDWKPPMNATAKPSKHKGHFLISEKDLKQDMFGVTYDNQIF